MLREQRKLVHRGVLVADAMIVGLSFLFAFMSRGDVDSRSLHPVAALTEFLPALLIIVPLWIALFKAVWGL